MKAATASLSRQSGAKRRRWKKKGGSTAAVPSQVETVTAFSRSRADFKADQHMHVCMNAWHLKYHKAQAQHASVKCLQEHCSALLCGAAWFVQVGCVTCCCVQEHWRGPFEHCHVPFGHGFSEESWKNERKWGQGLGDATWRSIGEGNWSMGSLEHGLIGALNDGHESIVPMG
eukprot:1161263-Pelagomonas_calceolata.AAC.38